jgi:hypothetical protein
VNLSEPFDVDLTVEKKQRGESSPRVLVLAGVEVCGSGVQDSDVLRVSEGKVGVDSVQLDEGISFV